MSQRLRHHMVQNWPEAPPHDPESLQLPSLGARRVGAVCWGWRCMSGLALYVGPKMVIMPIPFGVGVGCVGLALHVALLLACRSFLLGRNAGKDPGTGPLATDLTLDP